MRLGLRSVRHVGDDLAERIEVEREANGPYTAMEDLKRRLSRSSSTCSRRWPPPARSVRSYDADGVPLDRRRALWGAGAVAQTGADRLAGLVTGGEAPTLPDMTDRWRRPVPTCGPPGSRPTATRPGSCGRPSTPPGGRRPSGWSRSSTGGEVLVGGVVTHRQRPATAAGITFMNLEDETGLINVICSGAAGPATGGWPGARPAMLVRGRLRRSTA